MFLAFQVSRFHAPQSRGVIPIYLQTQTGSRVFFLAIANAVLRDFAHTDSFARRAREIMRYRTIPSPQRSKTRAGMQDKCEFAPCKKLSV